MQPLSWKFSWHSKLPWIATNLGHVLKVKLIQIFTQKGTITHCWWKKSCTTWDVKNPVNTGINYLSTGAGFFPSTVWLPVVYYELLLQILPMALTFFQSTPNKIQGIFFASAIKKTQLALKDSQLQAIFGLQVQTARIYFNIFQIGVQLKTKSTEQHRNPNLKNQWSVSWSNVIHAMLMLQCWPGFLSCH